MYRIAVGLIVALHLGFVGYVVVGGFLATRWPRTIWLHIPAVSWGVLIVAAGLDCPLTWLERRARAAAGMAALPSDGFIAHYLTGVVYPAGWTAAVEVGVAAVVVGSWVLCAREVLRHNDMVDGMRALVIVDVQNDFCEGGALPVPGAAAIAHDISRYLDSATGRDRYQHVVATKDHHIDPGGHFSEHPDFVTTWPPHCVAGTAGADFHPDLCTDRIESVFRKGAYSPGYSGFDGVDDDDVGLGDWLHRRSVDSVDVVGVATDHCVRATAEDAVRAGFATAVLPHLTAGVAPDATAAALTALRTAGVELLEDA